MASAKMKMMGRIVGGGFAAMSGISTFNQSRESGNDVVSSAAKAGFNVMLTESVGFLPYVGIQLAGAAGKGVVQGGQQLNRMARDMQRQSVPSIFRDANFMDTQANYTMRQAGMKLAEASKFNLQQSIMGNEARYIGQ